MPHQKRILLADSDESFSMILKTFLRKHEGFHVLHTREDRETMDTIHRHRPHILLLDYRLPRKGGFHVLEQLWEGGHKLSTILMTALPTNQVVDEAHDLGAKFVLPKPFAPKALTDRIHDLLHDAPPEQR